jgi:hypothetical protein
VKKLEEKIGKVMNFVITVFCLFVIFFLIVHVYKAQQGGKIMNSSFSQVVKQEKQSEEKEEEKQIKKIEKEPATVPARWDSTRPGFRPPVEQDGGMPGLTRAKN